ncbi:MAG: hypothetical protein E7478_07885 [Ruminococcaceae bacterium]|nr:hypothetical protein [Oscillospiraceae bacterium]
MDILLFLNARLQPIHRFEIEDALQEYLDKKDLGEVNGGGTYQNSEGEITGCEISICLSDHNSECLDQLRSFLNSIGIPKGSALRYNSQEIEIGTLEGLACYLNGRDLPTEVYSSCDVNYVIEQLTLAMSGIGKMYSYFEGAAYTALYFYGLSFNEMSERIRSFIDTYPLCQKCRMIRIA